MPRRLKNIRARNGKLQAYPWIAGKPRYKTFPKNTSTDVIREWIAKAEKRFAAPKHVDGSFGADIEEYKKRITALPTYKQKAAHLELWARALGRDRPRRTITAGEIDAVMQGWLTTPSRPAKGQRGRPSHPSGIDPQTVRKRRTSLLSLFVTLDGKAAENPVRASKNPKPQKAEIRGTDYGTIKRILAQLPTHRDTLEGSPTKLSLTKLRIAVLAYTGLPPGILSKLGPSAVDLAGAKVRVAKRIKGGGVEARTLPLTVAGAKAFRALIEADGLKPFAVAPLNVSFQRACRRANVTGLTIYDLRHSFGAQMYRTTKDDKTVGRFLLHAENSTQTARYRKAADAEVDRAAAAAFGASVSEK